MSSMNMYTGNYTSTGSGYTTPEHPAEINQQQHHGHPASHGIPMYPLAIQTSPQSSYHIPSPPLSDSASLPLTPTYSVSTSTSYGPTHGHGLQLYQQQAYPQQNAVTSYTRGSAGYRRRGSPDDLLEQAPIMQPRRPLTISTRKAEASHPYNTYGGRRSAKVHISDDDDIDELGDLPPNATDQQKIEHQRHRNTLAARRSRKRKELYKQELEQKVEYLTMETEKWRTRAEMLRRIIEGQGLGMCPDWSE